MNIFTPLIFLVLAAMCAFPIVLLILGLKFNWLIRIGFIALIYLDFMALEKFWKALDNFVLD